MKRRITIFTLLIVLLGSAFFMGLSMRYPVRYADIIRRNASTLDVSLIYAVIHTESKFKPEARSVKGAAGLMQITEETAVWLAAEMRLDGFEVSRLQEPEMNIAIGCFYINWLIDYYDGDIELALCAYNAGLGNVNRWLKDPRYSSDGLTLDEIPFPETRQYIRRVDSSRKIYDFLLMIRRNT